MKLRDLGIGTRIGIGFGVILLVMVAMSFAGYRSISKARLDYVAALDEGEQRLQAARRTRDAALATDAAGALERFDEAVRLQAAEQTALAQGSDAAARKRQTALWSVLAVLAIGILAFSRLLTRSITRPLAKLELAARAVAAGRLGVKVQGAGNDEIGALLRAVKSMDDALVATVSTVRSSSDAVALAANEIASGNADLSSRTESQASALEEAAATMEQLTEAVRGNAANAIAASESIQAAAQIAERGGELAAQVSSTMDGIRISSRRVGEIVGVIDSIAFQTSLLALNAAVEAATAGEQGRGFGVVASEVRALAQRSSTAAHDIKHIVDTAAKEVEAGALLATDAGQSMTAMMAAVGRVAVIMQEIARASAAQSEGIVQVNGTVAHMDEMTQQNAALVEQAAAAAQGVREQADALARAVHAFHLQGDPA
jgi:methyl-accepting chemotaxis protein